MKLFKKLSLLGVMSFLAIGLAACGGGSATKNKEVKEKTYTFATSADTPPFCFTEGGKLTGFDIDLIETIAKDNNVKVEWKPMKFNGIIPAIQSKQVDGAISAMSITDKRKKVVDFTDPYFDSGLVLVVKKDSPIKSLDDLRGKTLVSKTGTSSAIKAKEFASQYGFKVKNLDEEPNLYMDVESGGSDALINDYPFVLYRLNTKSSKLKIVGGKLNADNYGVAITKNNKEVYDVFNNGIKKLKENGKYDELYKKYFVAKK